MRSNCFTDCLCLLGDLSLNGAEARLFFLCLLLIRIGVKMFDRGAFGTQIREKRHGAVVSVEQLFPVELDTRSTILVPQTWFGMPLPKKRRRREEDSGFGGERREEGEIYTKEIRNH